MQQYHMNRDLGSSCDRKTFYYQKKKCNFFYQNTFEAANLNNKTFKFDWPPLQAVDFN